MLPPPLSSHLMSQVDATGNEKPLVMLRRAGIPFKLYQNYLIVVQGSLGSLEGLNFLIDTGANVTSIDRRIARKLDLKGQKHKLALLNQAALVERVELHSLQVGSLRVESLFGLAQD